MNIQHLTYYWCAKIVVGLALGSYISSSVPEIDIFALQERNTTENKLYSYCKCTKTPSACKYRIRQQRIKSLKMVVQTSGSNQFSHFYVRNPFLKFTRPGPTQPGLTMSLFYGLYLGQYYRYRREFLTHPWLIGLLKLGTDIFYYFETMRS